MELDFFLCHERSPGVAIILGITIGRGAGILLFGFVADLIGGSRSLLEDILFRVRELELREPDSTRVVRLETRRPEAAQDPEVRRASR